MIFKIYVIHSIRESFVPQQRCVYEILQNKRTISIVNRDFLFIYSHFDARQSALNDYACVLDRLYRLVRYFQCIHIYTLWLNSSLIIY